MKKVLAFMGLLASALYILNPGMGVFEALPDNLPYVGNLDEATATGILLWCIRTLRQPAERKDLDDPLDSEARD